MKLSQRGSGARQAAPTFGAVVQRAEHRSALAVFKPTAPSAHTLDEIAEFLRCSKATVRRRIASGALRAVRHGRVLRVLHADLDAFVTASRKWR